MRKKTHQIKKKYIEEKDSSKAGLTLQTRQMQYEIKI
jgi:hypothetical protein